MEIFFVFDSPVELLIKLECPILAINNKKFLKKAAENLHITTTFLQFQKWLLYTGLTVLLHNS